jgi:hypothetical protein
VPPTPVCEVAYTLLDAGRWLGQSARFVRWRPDRWPDDCWLDQLAKADYESATRVVGCRAKRGDFRTVNAA